MTPDTFAKKGGATFAKSRTSNNKQYSGEYCDGSKNVMFVVLYQQQKHKFYVTSFVAASCIDRKCLYNKANSGICIKQNLCPGAGGAEFFNL